MSPKAVALFCGEIKCQIHFCLAILRMIAHMYLEEFAAIALVSFQVYCYWSNHKSAILVGSTQSCF